MRSMSAGERYRMNIRCPAGLPAPPPLHLDPTVAGASRRLIRQAALPNPWVSGKEKQPAAPGGHVVDPGKQFAQLTVPPDQCRCRPRLTLHPPPYAANPDCVDASAVAEAGQLVSTGFRGNPPRRAACCL